MEEATIIKNTLIYLDSENDEYFRFIYYNCGCGCDAKANFFTIESSIVENGESVIMESKDEIANPIEAINDMMILFKEQGYNFKLVDIKSKIDESWNQIGEVNEE